MIGHIYIFIFPNGKRYVGQTIRSIEDRLRRHLFDVRRGCNLPVHNAMRKYGKEGIKIEKVFSFKCNQEYLDVIEQRTIEHFNTLAPYGYNLTKGGYGGAKSEEARFNMSKNNARFWKGKHLPEETKIKMSMAKKGKPGRSQSEETRAKISANNARRGKPSWNRGKPGTRLGQHQSIETRIKLSILHKGKHHSEKTKAKLSIVNKGKLPWIAGKHHSEEARAKMSIARKGRCCSAETRAKISAAKRKRDSMKIKIKGVNHG